MLKKIRRKESKESRLSKKRGNNRIKRKDIFFVNSDSKNFGLIANNRKGKYHKKQKKQIRFSDSIEYFCNANHKLIRQNKASLLKLNIEFSLFNNPTKVLIELLNLLSHAKIFVKSPSIKYDGYVSFGAIHLLDNLCWEIGRKRRWVLTYKDFPKPDISIISNLKSVISNEIDDEYEYMINERININRSNAGANQSYKAKATIITNMIEKAIRETKNDDNYVLPLDIHGAIKSAIGEQFDNIHLHSVDTDFGTLCGFYNKVNKEVTLLVYNFGKTIAETLRDSDLPKKVLQEINTILVSHQKKSFFNLTKNTDFSAENALTLLALQEGISSRIKYDITRGHGLIDFIGNCFELNSKCKVTVISGKTAIKIDDTYKIKSENVFGNTRRILAFNKNNDIFEKPDPKYVINTGVNFNGVIIETIIPLDFN